jgi:hypothetical protein
MLDVQMLLLKWLAVIGGALVGFLAVGWFVQLLCRGLFRVKVPRTVLISVRGLGMVCFGMLVYLWAFGEGGTGGLGGGGGWWPFGAKSGGGTGSATQAQSAQQPKPEAAANQFHQPPEPIGQHVIHIRLLGGQQVKDQRFYLVDEEKETRTWPDLLKVLDERRKQDSALKIVEIVLLADSVDRDNPAVTQLERWVKEHEMTPKLVSPATQ